MFIVCVALPLYLTQTFDYLSSSFSLPIVGTRVYVPWKNKHLIGIIVNYKRNSIIPIKDLKKIDNILDHSSLFSLSLWRLLHWASNYYYYPIGKILFNALPVSFRKEKKIQFISTKQWYITKNGYSTFFNVKSEQKQQYVLTLLKNSPIYSYQTKIFKISKKTLKILQFKKLVELNTRAVLHKHFSSKFKTIRKWLSLNTEQIFAVETICKKDNIFITWLLSGVINSGKTEVYLRVIKNVLKQDKQILVLVPNISIALKTIMQFRERFNVLIDIFYSKLTDNEKLAIWFRAKNNEVSIIIGTNLALFSPFKKLGIIIIHEEQNISYKQKKGCLYHVRDLAILRAKIEKIPIILISSFPTLETLYNVKIKKYHQLKLSKSTNSNTLIKTHLINLKNLPLKIGLSPFLLKRIKFHLDEKNHVILYLNKRGYALAFLCRQCGWIAKCFYCNKHYTFYKNYQQLYCCLCNKKISVPKKCPLSCSSKKLTSLGIGTEQLEEKLKLIFPNVSITRIDLDTINKKKSLKYNLLNINCNKSHIFIGTKALLENYYFSNITLVGFLNIDDMFFSKNFRSSEYFYQLYMQALEHVVKSNQQGEIVIQTNYPDHSLLKLLEKQEYNVCVDQMLKERKNTNLPPYTNHVAILAEDYNDKKVVLFLTELRNFIEKKLFQNSLLWILGPSPALCKKRNNYFRWQLLLQHPSKKVLYHLMKILLPFMTILQKSYKVKWILDVDPINN
ncbi:Primosomal protein N' [Candidatus Ecksteinia adelgidicola]|nr:Primosomal protein N' [Candidatus Ecksteinia adelgidicola]